MCSHSHTCFNICVAFLFHTVFCRMFLLCFCSLILRILTKKYHFSLYKNTWNTFVLHVFLKRIFLLHCCSPKIWHLIVKKETKKMYVVKWTHNSWNSGSGCICLNAAWMSVSVKTNTQTQKNNHSWPPNILSWCCRQFYLLLQYLILNMSLVIIYI